MKSLFTSSVRPDEANRRYILPGLDGLRAIAVLLVMVYHFWPTVLPGGMIGVDIFFVISGFLITSLLLREGALTGKIALGNFWIRRARRLLPAIALLILVMGPVSLLIGGDIQVNLGRQLAGAATFSSNWISIFAGNDYFAQTSPELFTNFWSLAVEEQFYVVWPLLIVGAGVLLRRSWRRFSVVMVLGIIASLSTATALLMSGAPISRVYYGTDTHLYGLLLGALLAFARPWSLYPPLQQSVLYRVAQPFGLVAFARVMISWLSLFALIPYAILVPESAPGAIPWGLFGASLLALGVIQGMLPDMLAGASEMLRRLLNFAPLRWVGERSYGLYLWHWPLGVLAFYAIPPTVSPWVVALGVLGLTLCATELSYVYIETPVRRDGLISWLRRAAQLRPPQIVPLGGGLTAVVLLIVLAFSSQPGQSTAQQAIAAGGEALGTPAADAASDPASDASDAASSESASPFTGAEVTVIGDSVTVAAAPSLEASLPGISINAEVSRSVYAAVPTLQDLDAAGARPCVVVALATNGPIETDQLDSILDYLGPDRRLVLVTGYGPARTTWIPPANEALHAFAQDHPDQVAVADWQAAVSGHPDLLVDDQVHPQPAGAELYAQTVTDAIASLER